ncbi:MAG: LacI family DNA-binding transcriptional regulator [Planctomycetia bacterium]
MTAKKSQRRGAGGTPPRAGSLKEVARRAGTSMPTASRVLNGLGDRYRISRATQDRVREAAAALRFSPNLVAKGLRLGSTRSIGLVVPDIANPFFAAIARAVSAVAHARGYSVLLGDTDDDVTREIELLAGLLDRQPDGLVVIPVGQQGDHLRVFETARPPVVLVDRGFPLLRLPSVMSDSRQGSFAAVSHLIGHGHRRIACIRGLAGTMPDDLRMQGYRDALAAHGIRFDARLVAGTGFGKEAGQAGMRALLAAGVEFTAAFAFSNLVGIGALESLLEAGLEVPADVSLVSFDEQPYSGVLAVPMTTVRQDPAEIGRLAIEMLCRRIEHPAEPPPASVVVATTLVPRESVAPRASPAVDRSARSPVGPSSTGTRLRRGD